MLTYTKMSDINKIDSILETTPCDEIEIISYLKARRKKLVKQITARIVKDMKNDR